MVLPVGGCGWLLLVVMVVCGCGDDSDDRPGDGSQPALPDEFNKYGGVSLTETRAHDFTSSKITCDKNIRHKILSLSLMPNSL